MPDADDRGTWYLPGQGGEGTLVYNAHPAGQCAGGGCALHGPSDHWASGMPLRWEHSAEAGGVMERLCPHGHWHDDPDDLDFRRRRGMPRPSRDIKRCGCPCDCDHDVPF